MLTGHALPDTTIFEIEYSGAVTAADFEKLRDDLAAFVDSHEPADLLATYSDVALTKIEPKALWEDLRSAGLEKKVRRAALLTDSTLLKTLSLGAGHFIHAELRVFALDERADAVAWLQR